MKVKKFICLTLFASLVFFSCHRNKIIPSPEETVSPRNQGVPDIIVTPLNIPIEYEIVGQVRVSATNSSDIKGLYTELGHECRKMGGDMVINVEAGQDVQDTTKAYPLPRGYGEDVFSPPYGPPYGLPYAWGTGTVIRIKDEDKRKAYFDAKEKENLGEACAIVGLPFP